MSSTRVAITDHGFRDTEPERAILQAIGAEVVERQCSSEDDVIDLADHADAILCDASPITRRVLESLPSVRVVSEYGIGVDNIDLAAAAEFGVWVTNVTGFCTEEVANHTIALLLAAARRLLDFDRAARRPTWPSEPVTDGIQRLSGQTLSLVGFGRIGRAVAERAAVFGLRVLAWSPSLDTAKAREAGVEFAEVDSLVARADFLSLHVPNTPETRGLMDARRLALMRPTAWLINTGRGALVDEDALAAALTAGRIAGAALDVRRREPPGAADPLAALPNTILTPHRAYYSQQSLRELQVSAARNAAAVLSGGEPAAAVVRPATPRPFLRRGAA